MVYFLQCVSPNFDVKSASRFGEIQYIFKDGEGRCSVFSTRAYCDEIVSKLHAQKFDENDYFALTGGVVAVSLALTAIVEEFVTVNVLIYSVRDGSYVHRIVNNDE